jgi:hypothetical protein
MQLSAFAPHLSHSSFARQPNYCIFAAHLPASPNGRTRAAKFPRATRRNPSMRRDPLAPPAQTRSSISRCRSKRLLCAQSPIARLAGLLRQGRPAARTRAIEFAPRGGGHDGVPGGPLSRHHHGRHETARGCCSNGLGHDRPRCSRAQSQPAVPSQPMGRGASVDRPGPPAITRL